MRLAVLLVPAVLIATACSTTGATVELSPLGGSGVRGTATLTAVDGGTEASVDVQGLPAGTTARVTLHGGTCSMLGASAAQVAELHAGAKGQAQGGGPILFRGTEKVTLVDIADNAHVLVVEGLNHPLACGPISP